MSNQFNIHAVNPIIPFFNMLYLRAHQILMLARDFRVFHMLNISIARQALHLVILLNDLAYGDDGIDGEQMDAREVLEEYVSAPISETVRLMTYEK